MNRRQLIVGAAASIGVASTSKLNISANPIISNTTYMAHTYFKARSGEYQYRIVRLGENGRYVFGHPEIIEDYRAANNHVIRAASEGELIVTNEAAYISKERTPNYGVLTIRDGNLETLFRSDFSLHSKTHSDAIRGFHEALPDWTPDMLVHVTATLFFLNEFLDEEGRMTREFWLHTEGHS